MKTFFEHIAYVKGKPHHIRRQIAFSVAAAGSVFVALIWFVGSAATGAFAIQGSDFAMSTGQGNAVVTTNDSGNQNIAGAGAAAVLQETGAGAHIEIVDTSASTSPAKKSEQTTLPF